MPELNPWPDWSQLNDATVDGTSDENRYNNCGPESVAECLKYLTGIELPADYIKDTMYGEKYTGYTDVPHIVGFLQNRCEVECEVFSGDANMRLQPVVRQAVDDGHPIIVLFFWKLEQPASGHFCPVVAYDDRGCTRANVWNRQRETFDWPKFEEWQKLGNCVVLRQTRATDLSAATIPLGTAGASAGSQRGPADPLVQRMRAMQIEAQPYIRRIERRRSLRARGITAASPPWQRIRAWVEKTLG